jgi:hypothetical protein
MMIGDEKLTLASPAFWPENIAGRICNPSVLWRSGEFFFTFFGRNPLKSHDSEK